METDEEDFVFVENRGASEDDDNNIIGDSTASNTNSSCRPDDDVSYGWDHHGCLAHLLQLVTNDAIKSDASVKDVIGIVNDITVFFRRSPKSTAKLVKKTSKNDTMFPHIVDVLQDYNLGAAKNKKQIKIPNDADRNKIKEIQMILTPFKSVTDIFQSNAVISSVIIPMLLNLQSKLLKIPCIYFHSFRDTLLQNWDSENRFKDVVKQDKFVISNILDPRYKLRMFGPKISQRYFTTPLKNEARKVIEDSFTQLRLSGQSELESTRANTTSQPSGRAFDFLLDEYLSNEVESELETYLKEPPQNTISLDHAPGGNDVLKFWKENQHRFPILASMAKIYLAIPASSGDVERLFSIAGTLKRQHRNRLDINLIEDMLIMREYHRPALWEKFNKPFFL
ncbi:unnamed protein product [Allacma fusca]|uniref:HAT C-terminal dimerisation domain-containing protein n=1 Tax=Allacma fusca TaxID=39272 RepID=A0A8J2LJN0_9HEXA|nr:unnamed protein product [Allacma fusca]